MTEYEKDLIPRIREEAVDVKECFTKFSFQAMSLSVVTLGLLVKFQPDNPFLGIVSLFIIYMVLSVARIGTYKYQTANRNYGYELYLDRARRFIETDNNGWKDYYRDIGWEEAISAWRIVQATVFEHLYHKGKGKASRLKEDSKKIKHKWFMPKERIDDGSVYYAGSYLRTVLSILFIVVMFSMASLIVMVGQFVYLEQYWVSLISFFMVILLGYLTYMRIKQLSARRNLLEEEVLCIHACAFMWQLVVVAHHRALAELPDYKEGKISEMKGYTKLLSKQVIDMTKYLNESNDIYQWLSEAPPNEGS